MDDEQLQVQIEELAKTLPKFPDGRVDYTNANEIYGVAVVVEFSGQILFMKRAADLHFYPNLWNVPSGFIDEPLPIKDIVLKELSEETNISEENIADVSFAEERILKDPVRKKKWHIFPALVRLKAKPKVVINWEHTEYTWLSSEEIVNYDRVPGVDENIRLALELV